MALVKKKLPENFEKKVLTHNFFEPGRMLVLILYQPIVNRHTNRTNEQTNTTFFWLLDEGK